jgi:hypothetical protein
MSVGTAMPALATAAKYASWNPALASPTPAARASVARDGARRMRRATTVPAAAHGRSAIASRHQETWSALSDVCSSRKAAVGPIVPHSSPTRVICRYARRRPGAARATDAAELSRAAAARSGRSVRRRP